MSSAVLPIACVFCAGNRYKKMHGLDFLGQRTCCPRALVLPFCLLCGVQFNGGIAAFESREKAKRRFRVHQHITDCSAAPPAVSNVSFPTPAEGSQEEVDDEDVYINDEEDFGNDIDGGSDELDCNTGDTSGVMDSDDDSVNTENLLPPLYVPSVAFQPVPPHIRNEDIRSKLNSGEAAMYNERESGDVVLSHLFESCGLHDWRQRGGCKFLNDIDGIPKLWPHLIDHDLKVNGILTVFPGLKALPLGSTRDDAIRLLERMMFTTMEGSPITRKKQSDFAQTVRVLINLLRSCCTCHRQSIESHTKTVAVLESQLALLQTVDSHDSNVSFIIYMCSHTVITMGGVSSNDTTPQY